MGNRRFGLLVLTLFLAPAISLLVYRHYPDEFVALIALFVAAVAFIFASFIELSDKKVHSLAEEIEWLKFQRKMAAQNKIIIDNAGSSNKSITRLTPVKYDVAFCAGREVCVTENVSPLVLLCYLKKGGEKSYTINEFRLSPGCILRVTATASRSDEMFAYRDYAHLAEAGLQIQVID